MSENYELDSMEFPCDPSTLPTSSELPLGDLLLEIKSIKNELSKENTTGEMNTRTGKLKVGGKVAVAVQFALVEPVEQAGTPYTKRFWIGSDEDPKAQKVGTWKRNAPLLMKMFAKAQVGGKTMTEYYTAAVGQTVGASIKIEKSKDPKYSDKHEAKDFFAPGEKPVRLIEGGDSAAALPPMAAAGSPFSSND